LKKKEDEKFCNDISKGKNFSEFETTLLGDSCI